MATSLKRILEINEDLSNKRVKMCTETGRFYEVGSNKNVIFVTRNTSDYWRSSYQRYRLSYYGSSKRRNRCVKSRIGSKKKGEDGKKENIENTENTENIENTENTENTEDIENTEDTDIIEELVDWQPTIGSDAFNEGFEVSVLNGIEAPVEDGDVVEQCLETMKSVKLLSVTMKMKKYWKYWKYWKYCMRTMKIIKRMKNMTLMRTIMIMNLTKTVKMLSLLKTMKLKKELKR